MSENQALSRCYRNGLYLQIQDSALMGTTMYNLETSKLIINEST